MDMALTPTDREVRDRARAFTQSRLFPHEMEMDETGTLRPEVVKAIEQAVRDTRLNGVNHTAQVGGQGMTMVQQCIVNEECGKATGELWAYVNQPPLPLRDAASDQIERFLKPACRGELHIAYSITEANAGSDTSAVTTTALKDGNDWVLNGEKWFVSGINYCQLVMIHAHVDGDPDKPAVFIVDSDSPGLTIGHSPRFMMGGVDEHPEVTLKSVRVGDDRLLGNVGGGLDITKDWFVEARLAIASRCCGMGVRAAEEATSFVMNRKQFGTRLADFQGVEFMLADMATRILAAKSLLYRIAAEIDAGLDRKLIHAKASAAKLYCSEEMGRVVDTALQLHGGRGVIRDYAVERLYRDIRVERIWEGTSEIQKLIIAGQIKKRGLSIYSELS